MPALKFWDGTAWQQLGGGGSIVFEQPGDPGAQPVGSIWIDTDDQPTVWGPPLVTSLPASPTDGQEVNFLADATNGVVWRLRYRSASASAYKWEFIGGPPLTAEVLTQEARTGNAYGDTVTPGPDVVVPLAGDYDFDFSAQGTQQTADSYIYVAPQIGSASTPSDNDAANIYSKFGYNDRFGRTIRRTASAANMRIRLQYKSSSANPHTWALRNLAVTPVRVG